MRLCDILNQRCYRKGLPFCHYKLLKWAFHTTGALIGKMFRPRTPGIPRNEASLSNNNSTLGTFPVEPTSRGANF